MIAIDELGADEIAARLSGPPEGRAALIREGAEAGVAEAQAVLGQMLLDTGEPRQAFAWLNKAAAQGHLLALNMVGRCYDLGWGVAVNKPRAAECFRVAAERGLDWGMYNYATALTLGDGVAADRPAALAWFREAAGMGNAKASNYVGSFYEDGWAVERDLDEATKHYRIAAEGGDFRGQFNHARMLAGVGNFSEARRWFELSAQTATPAFLAKARALLQSSDWTELRDALP